MEMTCVTPANTSGVSCANPNPSYSTTYRYNGEGLRTSETSPSGIEQFTYNVESSVPQLLMDGSNAYIYGPQGTPLGSAPVEQVSLSAPNSQSSVTYLYSDPEGVRLTFNSTGTITAGASYNAYGNVVAGGLSSVTPFGYAGGYTDPTGLIYFVNRYYDPSTGQFLSVDPLVGITDQPYEYAGGDPVNGSDPLGLWWCMPQGFVGPCPAGYTPGPPYNMSYPQPPGSSMEPGPGGYQLTLPDGETYGFTSAGGISPCNMGSDLAAGNGSSQSNSPTTTQEWQQYLSRLFPSSGAGPSSPQGGGGNAEPSLSYRLAYGVTKTGLVLSACATGGVAAGELGLLAGPEVGGVAAAAGCALSGLAAGLTGQQPNW